MIADPHEGPRTGAQVLRVVPVTLDVANAFVDRLHRHSDPTQGHRWSIGVELDGQLVGVAIVGDPVAPALRKLGPVAEIRRVCTDGTRNACSILYGACRRAARAMGFDPIITYTLPSEGGASLRAAGFRLDKTDAGGEASDWHNRDGRKVGTRKRLPPEADLVGGKWRWVA